MLAAHVISTTHGFWLPNDRRGSWSTHVRRYELYLAAGAATKTDVRQSLAQVAHDRTARRNAKAALKYPPVRLKVAQAAHVAAAIKRCSTESGYAVHALAVLPDHVYAAVATHAYSPARIVGHFKARCTQALLAADLHPFVLHRGANGRIPEIWAHQAWKVFLDTDDQVTRAVTYVEQNPSTSACVDRRTAFSPHSFHSASD